MFTKRDVRVEAAARVVVLLALTGCSFTPQSGQFGCTDGLCPSGLECIAELCIDPADAEPPLDGVAMDSDALDAGDDVVVLDAGSDASDAGPPPCTADFCANFDEAPDVEEGWTVFETEGASSTISREMLDDAPSAPAVFRAETQAVAGFRAARLSLQPTDDAFETRTPALRMAFQFRVTELSADAGVTGICGMRYGADEQYITIVVEPGATADSASVSAYVGLDTLLVALGPVVLGEWTTLQMTMPTRSSDGAPVGGGVSFAMNDVRQSGRPPAVMLSPVLRFDVGLATLSPGRAVVDIDDVEIDYLP